MCQFGDESKIIDFRDVLESENLIGYRGWYVINSPNEEKHLKSLNVDYLWPKGKAAEGTPLRDNSVGIYAYNYYNYYNIYNDYNYYNNYNYNNVAGIISVIGPTYFYKDGYRTSQAKVISLATLSDPRWFDNPKTKDFAEHFNKIVNQVAHEYGCKVIGYNEFANGQYK